MTASSSNSIEQIKLGLSESLTMLTAADLAMTESLRNVLREIMKSKATREAEQIEMNANTKILQLEGRAWADALLSGVDRKEVKLPEEAVAEAEEFKNLGMQRAAKIRELCQRRCDEISEFDGRMLFKLLKRLNSRESIGSVLQSGWTS